ncbi:hypothetical protein Pla123a_10980 [Posidoniimonas polymericola]|uniref:Uncharacterized protein n=1 Tax=Posidoniimonas polymericola TaxID=2528002 RepID=A0A5C5YUT1_9BACT|nr:hypothetical protein [Posidoniimonas polymericola]TWT78307.1 hypothetical protein Pla123a_10980 [Posidoniimonas polymericola]
MSATSADVLSAIDFAEEQFTAWRARHLLSAQQMANIREHYCQWRSQLTPETDGSHLFDTVEPDANLGVDVQAELRRLSFLRREIQRRKGAQHLSEGAAQQMQKEVDARTVAIRSQRQTTGEPNANADQEPTRGWFEMLLDPRSLHALMGCGGGLLVLGLVAWLWSVGVFENRLVVASLLGGVNIAALAAGAAVVLRTPYQTAGRAVTLLACLVMPLNLWLYDAQGLITLKDGGHLWAPALAICALYAGVARLLKDPTFVYALVGGVTMTGLLFLADQHVDRLWEVIAPSALLVVIGVVCVHVERLFAPGDGPFSRERFGTAFFNSGHLVMGVGLVVLLVGRVVGRFYDPVFADLGLFEAAPLVGSIANAKLMALALAAVGAYTYFYSLFSNKGGARYAYSGIGMLLWCEVIALDVLAKPLTEQLLVVVLASTAVAASAGAAVALRLRDGRGQGTADRATDQVVNAAGGMAYLFSVIALVLGAVQYARLAFQPDWLPVFDADWMYVISMALVAVAGAYTQRVHLLRGRRTGAAFGLQLAAVAATLAGAGALGVAGVSSLPVVLAAMAAVTLVAYFAVGRVADAELRGGLLNAAEVAGATLLLISVPATMGAAPVASVFAARLWLGAFFAEAAVLFAVSSGANRHATGQVLAALSAWAAGWQWLQLVGLETYSPMLAGSVVGVVCLMVDRLRSQRIESGALVPHQGVGQVGLLLTGLGGLAGLLLAFNRLAAGEEVWELVGLMLGQTLVGLAAAALTRSEGARRGLLALAGCQAGVGVLVVNALSALSFGQRVELLLVATGGLLLIAGHMGWRREGQRRSNLVTFNLGAGSLLAAVPLCLGLLSNRFDSDTAHWAWLLMHDVGVLAVGLGLLGAGVLCRVRSTTLVGAATMTIYVASLVMLIDVPDRLQSVSVYMMVGGGAFFGVAVLLSVYRDRLLSVPDRIRNGDGLFRVLSWR